jgi:hypothetical protein
MLPDFLEIFDPTIATLYIGGITAVLAAGALYYAKKAPEKKDLERVETNTANTTQRLEQMHTELADNTAKTNERLDKMQTHLAQMRELAHLQSTREELMARAQRVSITATSGMLPINHPAEITLTLKVSDVAPSRVELYEADTPFGSFQCREIRDKCWSAIIQPRQFQQWYASGKPVDHMDRRRVKLRVYMFFEGQEEREVHRDFAVQIRSESGTFSLDGNC